MVGSTRSRDRPTASITPTGSSRAPDVVLATGDLADLALPEDYRALRDVGRLAMPVYVIPGNDDDRAALRGSFGELRPSAGIRAVLHYAIEKPPPPD